MIPPSRPGPALARVLRDGPGAGQAEPSSSPDEQVELACVNGEQQTKIPAGNRWSAARNSQTHRSRSSGLLKRSYWSSSSPEFHRRAVLIGHLSTIKAVATPQPGRPRSRRKPLETWASSAVGRTGLQELVSAQPAAKMRRPSSGRPLRHQQKNPSQSSKPGPAPPPKSRRKAQQQALRGGPQPGAFEAF